MKFEDIEGLQEAFDSFERIDEIKEIIILGKKEMIRRIILE